MVSRSIGSRLRKFRKDFGISAKKLASDIHTSKQAISNYENDIRTPRIDTMDSIARHYQISLDYLIGTTEYKYNPYEKAFDELMKEYSQMNEKQKRKLIRQAQKIRESQGG